MTVLSSRLDRQFPPRGLVRAVYSGMLAGVLLAVGCVKESRLLNQDVPNDAAAGALANEPDASVVDAASDADSAAPIVAMQDWSPLAPDASYQGRTLDAWVAEWARWHVSIKDCTDNPYFDTTGAACGLYQDDSAAPAVFFLEDGDYPTQRTRCSIPLGKPILVPLTYYVADGQLLTFDELDPPSDRAADADAKKATMRDLHLALDGVELSGLPAWGVAATQFDATIPSPPNYFSCHQDDLDFEGKLADAYVAGYFVLLPAPSPGKHEIRYGGTRSVDGFDYVDDVRTIVTVY